MSTRPIRQWYERLQDSREARDRLVAVNSDHVVDAMRYASPRTRRRIEQREHPPRLNMDEYMEQFRQINRIRTDGGIHFPPTPHETTGTEIYNRVAQYYANAMRTGYDGGTMATPTNETDNHTVQQPFAYTNRRYAEEQAAEATTAMDFVAQTGVVPPPPPVVEPPNPIHFDYAADDWRIEERPRAPTLEPDEELTTHDYNYQGGFTARMNVEPAQDITEEQAVEARDGAIRHQRERIVTATEIERARGTPQYNELYARYLRQHTNETPTGARRRAQMAMGQPEPVEDINKQLVDLLGMVSDVVLYINIEDNAYCAEYTTPNGKAGDYIAADIPDLLQGMISTIQKDT